MKQAGLTVPILLLLLGCGSASAELERKTTRLVGTVPSWLPGTWYNLENGEFSFEVTKRADGFWFLAYPATPGCRIRAARASDATLELGYSCPDWSEAITYRRWPVAERGCDVVLNWHNTWFCKEPSAVWRLGRAFTRAGRRVENWAVEHL